VLYRDRFEEWAARGAVRVVVTTRGFGDAFDGDDALLYDPDTTAAIILGARARAPGGGAGRGRAGGLWSPAGGGARVRAQLAPQTGARESQRCGPLGLPRPGTARAGAAPSPRHPEPHRPPPQTARAAGGDAEAEAEAREVCAEAEIAAVVADSAPAPAPVYLDSTPKSFKRWVADGPAAAGAARGGGGGGEGEEEEEEEEGEEGGGDEEEGAPGAARARRGTQAAR
jgi:hypothetical protein